MIIGSIILLVLAFWYDHKIGRKKLPKRKEGANGAYPNS